MTKNVKPLICVICDGEIETVRGWREGHNAQPVREGRCCGECERVIVLPMRIRQMKNAMERNDG